MKVEMNDFRRCWDVIGRKASDSFQRVGASGWYILGAEVEQLELQLRSVWSAKHVVATGNGLDALEIALRCVNVRAGEFVLTTPLSAFATTLAVTRVGAIPLFVDVDGQGLIDLDQCRDVCRRNPAIRTLLVVHLYGHALDMDNLRSLRDELELRIVEDCAQSILATWDGQPTGSVGDCAATSFYPTKNLGALGDAGAVITNHDGRADHASALRHYGQSSTYRHDWIGLNSRLDEIHAAILRDAILPHLSAWTAKRRSTAARYLEEIDNPSVSLPRPPSPSQSVWHLFPVLLSPDNRRSFVQHLALAGVATGIHYPRLIPSQRALEGYGRWYATTDLLRADVFARSEVSLPIHPLLHDEEITHVVAAVNSWNAP